MSERVFVSSTFRDLIEQRSAVIKKLREAGFDVFAMEDGVSDPDHPANMSIRELRSCKYCVAIIGFRKGTISSNDQRKRSITELEIDEAIRRKIPLFVFMLEDMPENRQLWPAEFNDLHDPEVVRWRNRLAAQHTCSYFSVGETPDPLPAIVRNIALSEKKKSVRIWITVTTLVLTTLFFIILFLFSNSTRRFLLGQFLEIHDPVTFNGDPEHSYKVARLLDGTADIRAANFSQSIAEARESFCLFANVFGSIRDHITDFRDAANRGVQIRFIITDFAYDNPANWESLAIATTDNAEEDRLEAISAGRNVEKIIRQLQSEFPGNFELRFNQKPVLFTMWIRDAAENDGIAHLGVHYYGKQKAEWPAFRFSNTTGSNQLQLLQEQFEYLWQSSIIR